MAEKIERVYTVPLAREFRKVPRWRRAKRAIAALKKFMKRHMKSENIKIEQELNEKIWERGAKNPYPKIKVVARKEDDEVRVQLFGLKFKEKEKKKEKKLEEALKEKEEVKKELKTEVEKKKEEEEKKVKPTKKSEMKQTLKKK